MCRIMWIIYNENKKNTAHRSSVIFSVDFRLCCQFVSFVWRKIISFHSVFIASNSIRHGHLCLWFTMFRPTIFFSKLKKYVRKSVNVSIGVGHAPTGWNKVELFTRNLPLCFCPTFDSTNVILMPVS